MNPPDEASGATWLDPSYSPVAALSTSGSSQGVITCWASCVPLRALLSSDPACRLLHGRRCACRCPDDVERLTLRRSEQSVASLHSLRTAREIGPIANLFYTARGLGTRQEAR